ncbi:hypothetical protein NQ314_019315 [Rhamnusium bicolor]|uniref:Uncharacterized protein n=1 Tax=Rhamnusium bicolor TaxID=1586634 RepID=A0AAV8WMW8_9CUCU|nr:hypothetical protein NQ314_019315 [Rhamnusium bicolor]
MSTYGLFIATTIIPGCSPKKIEDILKNNEVKLWTNQLKVVYNKQPSLIITYLNEHKKRKSELIFDNNFLKYVAQSDPAFFWKLLENHEINNNLKLGRRTTKKIIMSKTHEIINEPKKYVKYFRHETLVRNLNKLGEFKQLYHNLFPRDIEKLDNGHVLCNKLLKYYPKHNQYKLFTETFKEVMNENILSNLSCLDDYFLELIVDKDVRERLAQLKYMESNDIEYIKYYQAEKSFTLIKEKINVTAVIGERTKLLCILVKSSAINKDLKFLEKVNVYYIFC